MRNDPEETAEVLGADLPFELSGYIGYLVRRVFAAMSAGAATPASRTRDFVVLSALAEQDACSQLDLAERLGINRTIMVKLIDRLQAVGQVERARNPSNRRSYVLSLTPAGQQALGDLQRVVAERDDQLTDALSPPEREQFNSLLQVLLPERERSPGILSSEYLVTQVHYALRRRGDALLAADGLRARHFGPLTAIDKFGPCPQQQLARFLAITEPAAAQMVDELVQGGLVARGQDPTDRRRYALVLTAQGRRKLGVVRAAVDRLQAEITRELGADNAASLRYLLGKLLSQNISVT